jgi:hypothetical protein
MKWQPNKQDKVIGREKKHREELLSKHIYLLYVWATRTCLHYLLMEGRNLGDGEEKDTKP